MWWKQDGTKSQLTSTWQKICFHLFCLLWKDKSENSVIIYWSNAGWSFRCPKKCLELHSSCSSVNQVSERTDIPNWCFYIFYKAALYSVAAKLKLSNEPCLKREQELQRASECKQHLLKSLCDLGAFGDLDYAGWAVWSHFMLTERFM